MANRYWVGGGSSVAWTATGNTNWSATSGGANNASVPGSGDFCIFDANSGSGSSSITGSFTIQGLDCTGFTGTLGLSNPLTINTAASNAFKLNSTMTLSNSGNGSLNFTNSTGTCVLTSAGKTTLGSITINGAGTVQQADNLSLQGMQGASLTLSAGTFDCNSHTLNVPAMVVGGSTTRQINLGTALSLAGNVSPNSTAFDTSGGITGLTINNAGTCPITILDATTLQNAAQTYNWGGLTLGAITVQGTTENNVTVFSSNFTCSSLTLNAGTIFELGAAGTVTLTITNAFTWTGTSTSPIIV